jgi:rRNA maturation protein Rpf1
MANIGLSDILSRITLSSEIRSFKSTSEEPSKEKVFANLMQEYLSSVVSSAFRVVELIKNPNILLNDWSFKSTF